MFSPLHVCESLKLFIVIVISDAGIGVESPTTSGVLGRTQQRLAMELVVPLAAVGGAIILIVAVFLVVLGFICCAYKKKNECLIHAAGDK